MDLNFPLSNELQSSMTSFWIYPSECEIKED